MPLKNLAMERVRITGMERNTIRLNDIQQELENYFYWLIEDVEKKKLNDTDLISYIIGDEKNLLLQKCLTPYWGWRVLQKLEGVASEHPIAQALEQERSHAREMFGAKLSNPLTDMKPEEVVELTAYGFLLWDEIEKEVVVNPIFAS